MSSAPPLTPAASNGSAPNGSSTTSLTGTQAPSATTSVAPPAPASSTPSLPVELLKNEITLNGFKAVKKTRPVFEMVDIIRSTLYAYWEQVPGYDTAALDQCFQIMEEVPFSYVDLGKCMYMKGIRIFNMVKQSSHTRPHDGKGKLTCDGWREIFESHGIDPLKSKGVKRGHTNDINKKRAKSSGSAASGSASSGSAASGSASSAPSASSGSPSSGSASSAPSASSGSASSGSASSAPSASSGSAFPASSGSSVPAAPPSMYSVPFANPVKLPVFHNPKTVILSSMNDMEYWKAMASPIDTREAAMSYFYKQQLAYATNTRWTPENSPLTGKPRTDPDFKPGVKSTFWPWVYDRGSKKERQGLKIVHIEPVYTNLRHFMASSSPTGEVDPVDLNDIRAWMIANKHTNAPVGELGDTFLFHGTKTENMPNIDFAGLKLPKGANSQGIVQVGNMLRDGIYGAPDPRKSWYYTDRGNNRFNASYMFICRFKMKGKPGTTGREKGHYADTKQNPFFREYATYDPANVCILWKLAVAVTDM
jgi:hypothetical protein